MKLLVVSHKPCWDSTESASGYATDGGFPFQMSTLSQLFDSTRLLVPCDGGGARPGEIPLSGHNLSIRPLTFPKGRGVLRKLGLGLWLLGNGWTILREIMRADAVHTPIPGDVGTLGMLAASFLRKPLFIRHCGNWLVQRTAAEHFWKWFMVRFAGGRNVMLATGGASCPPSPRNPNIRWIFSSSLTAEELRESARAPRRIVAGGPIRLIIVSRQEKAKGTGLVIKSLPLVHKRFPEVYFDVVGDGGAYEEFRELARNLNLADKVVFHRKVNHERVMELLRTADLFCFPTTSSEGFPKAPLEALACGVPVITTRVSVLPDLIGTGCGILLDEASAPAVAEGIMRAISDPEAYRSMSMKGMETVAQYSLENWRDTIGDVLGRAWGPLRVKA